MAEHINSTLAEADFIYCGKRILVGRKLGFAVRVILHGAVLSNERLFSFESKKHSRFVIGGVYTGAAFNDSQSLGLERAVYVKVVELNDVIMWEAKNGEAEIQFKSFKLEENAKQRGMIDSAVLDLRHFYHSLSMVTDRVAVEQAVLRALRKPLKQKEKEKHEAEH